MASIEERTGRTGTTHRVVWWEPGRRRQQLTFTDPAEAARFAKLVEGSGNRWPEGWLKPTRPGPAPKPDVLTFGEWALTAIGNRTRATERTKADYRRDLERHLLPVLGDVPLDGITDTQVSAWLTGLRAKLSDKTVRNLNGFASSVMDDACNQRPPLATHNPFARKMSEHASVHTEEMVFLTVSEFAAVLRWVREEYRPLVRLLYGTGLRYGEATALTVRDVDLLGKRKTLTVNKAWKRTGPAEYAVGEPKTPRSRRTLSISPELVELLIPLVSGRRGDELLFQTTGGRIPHSEFYKRGWAPAVARARVCDEHWEPQRDGRHQRPRMPEPCDCAGVLDKTPRVHDLRHSHVAWLISEGVGLPAISRRLGHSSITITMDRYGHLDPSLDEQINAAVDKALTSR